MNLRSFAMTAVWQSKFARLHGRVGSSGVLGLILMTVAALLGWSSWHQRWQPELERDDTGNSFTTNPPIAISPLAAPLALIRLPSANNVPVLLRRFEIAAKANGLAWPRAEYVMLAATTEEPAALEVRCVVKGPYPNLRKFLTSLLLDTPTMTLREFSVGRPSVEAAEVEAKLVFVVFLASHIQGIP